MRVLFTTTNWTGLYLCMVPLGWALQAAGHEVRVACSPEQSPKISAAGLVPVPLFRDLDVVRMERMERFANAVRSPADFHDDVPLIHPDTGAAVSPEADADVDTMEAQFEGECTAIHVYNLDAAAEFARMWRPSLVVHDLMTPEGVLAAEIAGVPSVYHSLGMFGGVESCAPEPTGAFPKHGAGDRRPPIRYVVDPTPDALLPDHGQALRIPIRYLPYNGPGEMPAATPEPPAKPRVCLLWSRGSARIFGPHVPALSHTIDEVVAAGAELKLLGPAEIVEALGPLPPGAEALADFPMNMLLPDCAAIIHQGSGNPMMTGAVFGLPQLALGLADDGIEMGRRFAKGGSGLHLPGLTATQEQIRDAAGTLLHDPSLTAAAAEIQAEISTRPTPLEIVRPLERLAREGELSADELAELSPQHYF